MLDNYKMNKVNRDHILGTCFVRLDSPLLPMSLLNTLSCKDMNYLIDDEGIPYFSSSVIRDVFLHGALDLKDNKKYKKSRALIEDLIKDVENNKEKLISFSSVTVNGYHAIKINLRNIKNFSVKNSQNILDYYMCRIKPEDHTQKHQFAFKAGTKFNFDITVRDSYKDIAEEIFNSIKSIGRDVNKGFGKVSFNIDWCRSINKSFISFRDFNYSTKSANNVAKINDEVLRLEYIVTNLQSCAFNNYHLDSCEVVRYIPGGVIYDFFKDVIDLKDVDIQNCHIICSNAYITIDKQRGLPAPLSLLSNKLNKEELYDFAADNVVKQEFVQFRKLDDLFTTNLNKKEVVGISPRVINDFSVNYSNPIYSLDKNTIHTNKHTLMEGLQYFKGFIEGPSKIIRKIQDYITYVPIIKYVSSNKLSTNNLLFRVTNIENIFVPKPQMTSDFNILCASPIFLENKYGCYTTQMDEFINEFKNFNSLDVDLEVVNSFTDTIMVSEFLDKYNLYSSDRYCLSSGSCFRVKTKRDVDISKFKHMFLGLYNNRGYGEVVCYPHEELFKRHLLELDSQNDNDLFKFSCNDTIESKNLESSLYKSALKKAIWYICQMEFSNLNKNEIDDNDLEDLKEVIFELMKTYPAGVTFNEVKKYFNEYYKEMR